MARAAFYPPTVLTGLRPGMPAYEEELFGPVASVIPAKDEAEAITVANSSVFGLGGGVFTRDLARGERIATEAIEAGSVCVNATVVSDPRLPFGGVKESGYGRELSHYGIKEFVNIKTVVVADGTASGKRAGNWNSSSVKSGAVHWAGVLPASSANARIAQDRWTFMSSPRSARGPR